MWRMIWLKWMAVLAGSATATLNLGSCITYYLLMEFILSRPEG